MSPVFLASIASLFYGFENIFSKTYGKNLSKSYLTLGRSLVGFFIAAIFSFLFPQELPLFPALYTLLLSTIAFLGFVMYHKSIELGSPSTTSAIATGKLVLVILIGIMVYGYEFSFSNMIWVVLIFIGISLLTINPEKWGKKGRMDLGTKYAIYSTILYGITVGLFSYPMKLMGPYNFLLLFTFGVSMFSLIYLSFVQKDGIGKIRDGLSSNKGWIAVGLSGNIAFIFLLSALGKGNPNIINVIAGCSPIVTAALSFYIFKERLGKRQYLGILVTVIGVCLLTYFK